MYTFRQTFVYILLTKLKELWQLIFCTKCLQKFLKMWDTFCIQTLCIHFVYINSDLQNVHITKIMYSICIQNSYRMYLQFNCMLNQPHISAYFDPFVVHFLVNHCTQLRLETC